jgi:hypothetical protein
MMDEKVCGVVACDRPYGPRAFVRGCEVPGKDIGRAKDMTDETHYGGELYDVF